LKLLLDSHVVLWWSSGDKRLGRRAAEILAADSNAIYVSAASWWELGLKCAAGRLRVDMDVLRAELRAKHILELPVTTNHADAARNLPSQHTDPFDHMLVAQASVEGLALLTRDKKLKAYGSPVLCV
jgi:PIN domain nuclease of toxin-antitoxin system